MSEPSAYQRILNHLLERIHAGEWQQGNALPSEMQLAKQFQVSRMTVNRAMRELVALHQIERRQGSGTYVSQQHYHSSLVTVRNIAQEIRERGHRHHANLLLAESIEADEWLSRLFKVALGATLFRSKVLHFENHQPIQLEDRYVAPALAPDYLAQDFTSQTPNAYLMQVAPLQGAQFKIDTAPPTPLVAQHLNMQAHQRCLVLRRVTWSKGQVASWVTLWHHEHHYSFTGSMGQVPERMVF